jgi:CheY-like chemotaxis protein
LSALENVVRNNVILKTELETQGHLISGNVAQIKEVLKNLVTNASEAIGNSQGIIQITVSQVTSTEIRGIYRYPVDWELQETVYACLEVKDTGTGIASNDIQQIFDPFFSSKFTGRGLGLPVVLGIVRAHNGGITVESELNKGSAFRVYFPLATQSKPSHRDEDATPSEMQWGGMVLLVDDDEHIRKMSKNMLKHIGFSTLAARDGIEAVEMFRKHQDSIRIVICDLTMPHMNGWETIDALRNLSSDIPVILVSGYDEAHAMHRCNQDNSVMFLHKPYSISDLRGALQNIFQANVNEG